MPVGIEEGLKHDSAVNLDHVQTIEQDRRVGFIGTLAPAKMQQVCRALAIATPGAHKARGGGYFTPYTRNICRGRKSCCVCNAKPAFASSPLI